MDTLIVDDLLLLLTETQDGHTLSASEMAPLVGGALLSELVLSGRVGASPGNGSSLSDRVVVFEVPRPQEPLLRGALEIIGERRLRPDLLVEQLGSFALPFVQWRLEQLGLSRRRSGGLLGLFRSGAAARHLSKIRHDVARVLAGDEDSEGRASALVAVLWGGRELARLLTGPDDATGRAGVQAERFADGLWPARVVRIAVDAAAPIPAAPTPAAVPSWSRASAPAPLAVAA